MKRCFFFLGAFILLLLLGGTGYLLLRPGSPISQAGCDRIEHGISEADVQKILGGPEGNYHDGQVDINVPSAPGPGLRIKVWIGNDGAALVYFDKTDKVRHVHFAPALNRNESFFAKVRRWLRL
jgi:hypothetical protein